MSGLDRHIRTVDVEEHARLAFRAGCPRCRLRLAGPPPSGDVVPMRAKAALATAAVLVSGALPAASTAAEDGGGKVAEIEPPPGPSPTDLDEAISPPDSGGDAEPSSGPPISPPDDGGGEAGPPISPPDDGGGGQQMGGGEEESGAEQGSGQPDDAAAPPLRDVSPQPTRRGNGESASDASGDASGASERASDGGGSTGGAASSTVDRQPAASTASAGATHAGGDQGGGARSEGADKSAHRESGHNDKRDAADAGKGKAAGATARPDDRYTVEHGDSLWMIARDLLGSDAGDAKVAAKVSELWELNDTEVIRTGDPDLIHPGQELRLR